MVGAAQVKRCSDRKEITRKVYQLKQIYQSLKFNIMKIIKNIAFALLTILVVACDNDDNTGSIPGPEQIRLKVIAKGTAIGQPKTIVHPKTGETLESVCFLMELVDPDTGNIIGTLQDCVVDNVPNDDGSILSKVITSINLNGRGTIQAENQVLQTSQPPVEEFNFTTSFTPTENNVISTSFEFENMEGTVALDGVVNLANFEQGIVTFNCDFIIDLKSY